MKVSWSPQDKEKFLTFTASTVKLYQTFSYSPGEILPEGSLQISDERYAANIASVSDLPQMKCVEWYPGQSADTIIAIGLASPGKVILSNFGRKGESELINKEFWPKHQRHCIYLSWNPVHTNFLAEGLDKARNESCIYIWDVNARTNSDLSILQERQRHSSNMAEASVVKTCLEIGAGDMTSSFSWFNKEPWTFVAGMNGKQLRVYDLREPSRAHLTAHSKDVYGVCSDPLHESRVAAYAESHVTVWDVRQFEKPILAIPTERDVLKVAWCPTRSGDLAVLCKGSTIVKLYDIRHSVTGTDDLEPVIFDRTLQPNRQHAVTYFAWHPTCENRISTLTPTGHVNDNFIFDKLPISFNADMAPAWIFGRHINIQTYEAEADMSVRIKQRARQEYGLHRENLWNNAVVVADEPNLHALWHWLDLSTKLLNKEEVPKKLTKTGRYIGVLDLLEQDSEEEQESDEVCCMWQYPDGIHGGGREKKPMLQYRSEARLRSLQLCGWWYNKDPTDSTDPFTLFLDSMVNDNMEYERAAAIALFNLKIGKAVEILSSDVAVKDSPQLGIVAMALSGFTEDRNAMWRKTWSELRSSMKNPYLRAMFSFLASDWENYEEVLKDDVCMAVKDRVAFACLYLNDAKLLTYLSDLCRHLKQAGDLDGVLLTGLTNEEGLELLGNYVDLTSDIQTASLAIVYSSPSDLSRDERVVYWIEGYRDLLNCWKMWHQRAKFDIIRHELANDQNRVQGQCFVSCNYCGKSIACNRIVASRSRNSASTYNSNQPPGNKPKNTICPGCRKPLPRCALCLTNLGTPSGSNLHLQKDKSEHEGKLSSFDNWFAWCQTCRHGGHCEHITDWFKDHKECPVTGCSCHCMTLDPNSQLVADHTV